MIYQVVKTSLLKLLYKVTLVQGSRYYYCPRSFSVWDQGYISCDGILPTKLWFKLKVVEVKLYEDFYPRVIVCLILFWNYDVGSGRCK